MQLDILDRFTEHLRESLAKSIISAQKYQVDYIPPIFLFLGLAEQEGSIGYSILQEANISTEIVTTIIKKSIAEEGKAVNLPIPTFDEDTSNVIERAALIALDMKHSHIGTEHLLCALIEESNDYISELLETATTPKAELHKRIVELLRNSSKIHSLKSMNRTDSPHGNGGSTPLSTMQQQQRQKNESNSTTPALDFFGTELTKKDVSKRIDPVIGREDEIDQLIHILARRTKNNPLLVGEPGVGKTAIVEGLAKRIAQKQVPDILLNCRIFALDMPLVIAGSMYRGEFESRIKQIIDEVQAHPNIILFIDEIHTIVGAGGIQGGNMDAANILKPALARGAINCIGATTAEEYRKYIEQDAALARRFQTITVEEPSVEQTVEILSGLAEYYEKYHVTSFDTEAIVGAATLADRYITDQRLPDKAIDLLDEAGAAARAKRRIPQSVQQLNAIELELQQLAQEKTAAVHSEDFTEAVELKDKEQTLLAKRGKLAARVKKLNPKKTPITYDEIAAIVSKRTGIPFDFLTSSSSKRHTALEKHMKKHILGQDHAIDAIMQVMKRAAAGVSSADRPLGSFLFLGPSGVGKTETAKILAESYFGNKEAIIRVDMSEFSEGFTVSKLIGSPAGYVGYNDSIQLSDEIRQKPYSVVLFDELEKAHPDVFNLLLQILDEGRLTDSSGRELNFKHSVIVMTSNIGIDLLTKQAELGFDLDEEAQEKSDRLSDEEITSTVLQEVDGYFPTEFLNRIDHQIVFTPLSETVMEKIVEKELRGLQQRLHDKGYDILLRAPGKRLLATKSFHPKHGARQVQRTITQLVEQPIAEMILDGKLKRSVAITAKHDTIVLETIPKKKASSKKKTSRKKPKAKK